MEKRSVILGLIALFLLVISVYVSFAASCWGEYTQESMDEYMACLDPCDSSAWDCYDQCQYVKENVCKIGACMQEQDVCIADCDAIKKTCTDSCESLKVKCGEEPPKEECNDEEYWTCLSNCQDKYPDPYRWGCVKGHEEECAADKALLDNCLANCKPQCEEEPKEVPKEEIPPEEIPEEETPVETPPEETTTERDVLMDAVATEGMSKEKIRSYYEDKLNKAIREGQNMLKDRAQEKFEQTRPLVLDAVNAKNDYEDALKKGGASEEELAKLEADFNTKTEELKSKLDDVLAFDPDNVDALWGLGIINRWQGDNQLSYENYRDALVSQFHRNVFKFNDRLDAVRDPAMRMRLMQTLLPNENIANVPTTETSPFLKWYDDVTKEPVQQVDKAKRKLAEQIDKIANALSLSQYLPKKLEEINEQ